MEKKKMSMFEVLTIIISTLLTFAAFYIALVQYLDFRMTRKIHRFELDCSSIRNDYTKLCSKALNLYKEIYERLEYKISVVVNGLIYRKNWICADEQHLLKIDDINVNLTIDPIHKTQNEITRSELMFHRRKITPYNKKSLVDNILIFLDHSHLWDNPTYIVQSITGGKNPKLQVYTSSYFNFYNSCMSFGYELAHFINNPTTNPKKSKQFRTINDLFDLSNRYCGIGTVTFTVFTNVKLGDQQKSYFIVQSRSEDVAEGKNIINAVPAGTYQPSVSSTKLEPLSLNIIREFGEEIRGKKEFTFAYSVEEIEDNKIAMELKQNLYFLGMGFNPLNAYLEILTLAIIDLSKDVNFMEFGTTFEEISRKLESNFEGTLELEEFCKQKLINLSSTYHAAPSLKEIAAILVQRMEKNKTDKDIYSIL